MRGASAEKSELCSPSHIRSTWVSVGVNMSLITPNQEP